MTPPENVHPLTDELDTEVQMNANEISEKKKKTYTSVIPKQIDDVISTAKRVASKWRGSSFTLIWKDAQTFESEVKELTHYHESILNTKGKRRALSNTFTKLDKEINTSVTHVKEYLREEYGRTRARSHYQSIGIEKKKNRYYFPADRDKRLAALRLLVAGIQRHGFQNRKYGDAYWQQILIDYEDLFNTSSSYDSDNALWVSKKNQLLDEVRLVLKSIYKILEANYPKSYKSVVRSWGFHKEKY